ncbi:RluA family pseudouridine synthase [Moraxella sp. VT-16-12]|uniref:RluA family pseudouridine synthase n=1 Tax=Moraxella sp. VT-16-12 TaxID=2014877 RepID=UPI000B8002B8|nr:RluA family pseudouridine synthase [Moraxella sp. VT-16-12]TWV81578.1 RluA family pseudouridine synthase [Moraxella sp. VT-16-12]
MNKPFCDIDSSDDIDIDHDGQNSSAHVYTHTTDETDIGTRLDKIATERFDGFSRVQIQGFIDDGSLTVNGMPQKSKYRVKSGDVLTLKAVLDNHSEDLPENIALDVVYEDDEVVVINKPAGLVVHPGAGNRTGTLVNALLYHYPDNAYLPRAGLVHRIDKDTSGLLIVARTKSAQLDLTEQLKDKSVYREYVCVATGVPSDILRHATIELPIARHRIHRTKMAVVDGGKPAITHITHATLLGTHYSLLHVCLETGRTHQIRVHLSHVGHALLGDKVYGRAPKSGLDSHIRQAVLDFPRQALHAHKLGFVHPTTGKSLVLSADLPSDMVEMIAILQDNS